MRNILMIAAIALSMVSATANAAEIKVIPKQTNGINISMRLQDTDLQNLY
jgi:hypothetical protein